MKLQAAILVALSIPSTPTWAGSVPDSLEQALLNRKQALELELRFVSENPNAYYLVIDLPSRKVYLKAGAHILRICAVQNYRLAGALSLLPSQLRMIVRIDPHTVEPGNSGLRLRGRRLPIDFSGRLIEGPRGRSRLYYSPALLIQPHVLPLPAGTFGIALDSSDVKALDSALRPGSAAILIPTVDFTPQESFP